MQIVIDIPVQLPIQVLLRYLWRSTFIWANCLWHRKGTNQLLSSISHFESLFWLVFWRFNYPWSQWFKVSSFSKLCLCENRPLLLQHRLFLKRIRYCLAVDKTVFFLWLFIIIFVWTSVCFLLQLLNYLLLKRSSFLKEVSGGFFISDFSFWFITLWYDLFTTDKHLLYTFL